MSSPLTLKKMKKMIGEDIYLLPTGNSVNRAVPLSSQILQSVIAKVGTRKIHVENIAVGSFHENGKYDSNNFGYLGFALEQDARDYLTCKSLISTLKGNETSWSHLSLSDVLKIKSIIEGE